MQHQTMLNVVNQFATLAERGGTKLPKRIITERDQLVETAKRMKTIEGAANLSEAVIASLEAGNDPTTDPKVIDAVVKRSISESLTGVDYAMTNRVSEFIQTNAAEMLDALRVPFDQAAKTLTDAHEEFGDISLNDATAVLSRGGDIADIWVKTKQADQMITDILNLWKVLGTAAPALRLDRRSFLLAIADVPADVFVDEHLAEAQLTPWDIVRRGFTLSLATPQTLADRRAGGPREIQRRQASTEEAFKNHFRAIPVSGAAR